MAGVMSDPGFWERSAKFVRNRWTVVSAVNYGLCDPSLNPVSSNNCIKELATRQTHSSTIGEAIKKGYSSLFSS